VAVPIVYFGYSSQLPDLDSPEAVRAAVAPRAGNVRTRRGVKPPFRFLTRKEVPKTLVEAWLSLHGCPDYLDSQPPHGLAEWSLLIRDSMSARPRDATESCDRDALWPLMQTGIAKTPFTAAIAARHLRRVLKPEDRLLALFTAQTWGVGIRGADLASKILLNRDFLSLDPAHAAELCLAEKFNEEYLDCTNLPMITAARDGIIQKMGDYGFIEKARVAQGVREPISCKAERRRILEAESRHIFGSE
jgi:hypothetical protein